ncbi:hypothetical protein ACFL20_07605 [Spirochaetota bacterium]
MQFVKCIASKPNIFNNITLDLNHRVVVIYGKNSSGKTFFAKCLIEGIFKRFSQSQLLDDEVWDQLFLDISFSLPPSESYRFTNNSKNYFTIKSRKNEDDEIIYSEIVEEDEDEDLNFIDLSNIKDGENLRNFLNLYDSASYIATSFIPSPSDLDKDEILDYSMIKNFILNDNSGFYNLYNNLQSAFKDDNLSISSNLSSFKTK